MEARSQGARAGRLLLVAVLAVGAVFLPGAARAEGTPPTEARSLTVTPSTDLDDGQTVTVDGTGWRPGALVFAIECVSGTDRCGGAVANRPVDADGTFTMALAVRVVFTAFDGTPIDCRVDACEVRAVNEENEDHFASVPIVFDPTTVLLPPPTMTVTPALDLVDGQTVTVDGTGFLPGITLAFAQCRPGQTTWDGCVVYSTYAETETDGSFSSEVQLEATFFHPDGLVDCRVEACELVVAPFFGGIQARAALAFDPDAPLLPPRAVAVTPDSGLADGDVVTVAGSNFIAGTHLIVLECGNTDALVEDCSGAHHQPVRVGADGTFSVALPVARTFDRILGGTFDCGTDQCVVRVLILGEEQTIDVPFSFAPVPPGPPPPATPVAAAPRFTG